MRGHQRSSAIGQPTVRAVSQALGELALADTGCARLN